MSVSLSLWIVVFIFSWLCFHLWPCKKCTIQMESMFTKLIMVIQMGGKTVPLLLKSFQWTKFYLLTHFQVTTQSASVPNWELCLRTSCNSTEKPVHKKKASPPTTHSSTAIRKEIPSILLLWHAGGRVKNQNEKARDKLICWIYRQRKENRLDICNHGPKHAVSKQQFFVW